MGTFDPLADLPPDEGMTFLPPLEMTPEQAAIDAALIAHGSEIYRAPDVRADDHELPSARARRT